MAKKRKTTAEKQVKSQKKKPAQKPKARPATKKKTEKKKLVKPTPLTHATHPRRSPIGGAGRSAGQADRRGKKDELLGVSKDWKKHAAGEHELPETRKPKEKHIEHEAHKQRTEQDKRLMMWAGVSFFMVVILFVWILNFKNTFKTIEANNTNTTNFEWSEITDTFSQTMDEVKKGLAELREGTGTTTPNVLPENEDIATSTEEDIKELQERLKDLEEKLDSAQVDLEE